MKFVKKLFLVLIMMFAFIALVGCGEENNQENQNKGNSQGENQVTEKFDWAKGLKVSAELNAQVGADVTDVSKNHNWVYNEENGQYTEEVERVVENVEVFADAKVTVDCQISAAKFEKFEDLKVALVVSVNVYATSNEDSITIPKTDIKLYLNEGSVYLVIPAALVGTETDLAVMVNLVQVYNDNIETVKTFLKEAIEMLKSLPAEELPEGFDLSVLDRIDVDNLKIEDLLGLVDILPEEYRNMIKNPQVFTVDRLLGILEDQIYDNFDGVITDEQKTKIHKYGEDVAKILEGFLPVKTTNGNTTKYELTEKQVKDTMDSLVKYFKDNFDDFAALVIEIDPEAKPLTNEEKEMTLGMLEGFVNAIKEAFTIKEAKVEYTTNGVLLTSASGALEFTANIDGAKLKEYEVGMDEEEKVQIGFVGSMNVSSSELTGAIEFPDFTSFQDMTEMVSGYVAGMLEDVLE